MQIAFFSEVFLPKFDGITNTLCRLFDYMEKKDHHSILFAPAGGPVQYASTVVIGLRGIPSVFYPDFQLVPPVHDVSVYIKAFKPDIIHLVNPVSLCLTGLWYGLEHNIPIVASYQTDIAGFAAQWGLGYLGPMIWSYLRHIHNQADLNLAPSNFTKQELVANQFKNVEIWSRGVDTTLYSPSKYSKEMRSRLTGGQSSAPLLLYVGRLSSEKRITWLRALLDQLPNVRLAIVGDGPQRGDLEKMFAGTATVFTGFLSGEPLAQAYASSDAFVFTGANETFGNVVLEAMASGLAVVVPNSGGVVDFVIHNKTGLLYEANDVGKFVAEVERLVSSRELSRQLGAAALEYARNRSWDSIFDKLMNTYQMLLEPRNSLSTHKTRPNPLMSNL